MQETLRHEMAHFAEWVHYGVTTDSSDIFAWFCEHLEVAHTVYRGRYAHCWWKAPTKTAYNHPGHLSEHEADTMINQLCKIVEDLTIIVDKHQAIEHSVSSLWKSAKELSGIFPQGKEDTWEYEEGRDETT